MKNKIFGISLAVIIILSSNCHICAQELTRFASGDGGIVAAGPKPSVKVGLHILDRGGYAVDAAVAVIFNLSVSDYGMAHIYPDTGISYGATHFTFQAVNIAEPLISPGSPANF